jgi:hypothetical protein
MCIQNYGHPHLTYNYFFVLKKDRACVYINDGHPYQEEDNSDNNTATEDSVVNHIATGYELNAKLLHNVSQQQTNCLMPTHLNSSLNRVYSGR